MARTWSAAVIGLSTLYSPLPTTAQSTFKNVGGETMGFIAKGDPLEIMTPITHVIIAGRDVNLMNKHLALYERYLARP